jgi:hypothetical protein
MAEYQKCGNCKWLKAKRPDKESKEFGIEELHVCGKYDDFVSKLDVFLGLSLPEYLILNPEIHGSMCNYYDKKE